jgi:hypothetical protein
MKKQLLAEYNRAGGYDLLTERDSGNHVLILTGKHKNSLEYWERLRQLSVDVICQLKVIDENHRSDRIEAR